MVFSSLLFLCVYLPLTLAAYYICPRRARNVCLLAASLIFYAWGEPKYVLLMLASIGVGYAGGRLIERFSERPGAKKAALTAGIAVLLGMLMFFKYANFLVRNVNALTGGGLPLLSLALPIGISFYSFQILSYLIDVYRGETKAQKNVCNFALYVTMFPQLIAGPIVRYTDVAQQIQTRRESVEAFSEGVSRFLVGLGKKVLLANQIGALWNEVSAIKTGDLTAMAAWMGAIAFMLQIYFDFSGYSDMAIGLGKMFGFDFPENFDHPYKAASVMQFWRKWHMTLSGWFRDYLYIPLGGNRKGTRRQTLNLLTVWALTGLWHGANWNFLLWGVYFFALLVFEKTFLLKRLARLPAWVGHVYTLAAVLFGWVIFACDDAARLPRYLSAMVGLSGGLVCSMDVYRLLGYLPLLAVGAFACTGSPKTMWTTFAARIRAGERLTETARALGGMAVLLCSICLLTADSYNPFLYFRF